MSTTTRKRKADAALKATRAPLACGRCRVKKLRCSGGHPCRTCLNASAECDFDVSPGRTDRLGGVDLSVRVTQLEKAVAELQGLVHGLAGPAVAPPPPPPATDIPSCVSGASAQSQQRADETSASRFLASTLPAHSGIAPFPPLMHHPSVWENRSRSPSVDAIPLGRTEYTAKAGSQDHPLSTGLIDEASALALYHLYMEQCHPTFPVLRYEFEHLCSKSPFLFTSVLAVASRYYLRFQQVNPSLPVISTDAIAAVKHLAYSHLGASMFRKQPGVMDVQAVLLLANWNLFGQGMSADNWLVSGHCGRLAYRIGLDRIANHARDRPVLCRWRAWLGWNIYDGFMCLGFGRPQMNVMAPLDEIEFLCSTEGPEDALLAALAQLSVLGRSFLQHLRSSNDHEYIVSNYNEQLDRWFLERGPPTDTSSKIALMYGYHVQMCINSVALNVTSGVCHDYASITEKAAKSVIELQEDSSLQCAGEYASLIIVQAAVTLIRLTVLLPSTSDDIPTYLDRATRICSENTLSDTGLGEHLAHLCFEFRRLAGLGEAPGESRQSDWMFDALNTTDLGQLFGVPVVEDWFNS